ncbi:hypothetical protein RCL1_004608 [Eukaryota sp. TZLM3-RCL]
MYAARRTRRKGPAYSQKTVLLALFASVSVLFLFSFGLLVSNTSHVVHPLPSNYANSDLVVEDIKPVPKPPVHDDDDTSHDIPPLPDTKNPIQDDDDDDQLPLYDPDCAGLTCDPIYLEYFTPFNRKATSPLLSTSEMAFGQLRPGKRAISNDPDAVDVVYCYVNGSDKFWETALGIYHQINPGFNKSSQWRDTRELMFSMRSVLKHVKFIHHFYIVVAAPTQIPAWLNAEHPFITFIYHSEIFPDPSHLPTFSSLAIESNIWRIPGLTNNFLYLNDDFFVSRDVPKQYFFTAEKKGLVHIEKWWYPNPNSNYYHNYIYVASQYLKNHFGIGRETIAGTYRTPLHAPKLLNRQAFNWTVNTFNDAYELSSSTRFRQKRGIPFFISMVSHSWVQQSFINPSEFITPAGYHRCSPSEFRFEYMKNKPSENTMMAQRIARIKPQFFCVNNDLTDQSEEATRSFISAMSGLYPDAGPWENI